MLWLAVALATEPDAGGVASKAFVARPLVGRPLLELRGGIDTASAGRAPHICGEVAVLPWLALDACGSGATWFHQLPIDEMSHYRVEGTVPLAADGRGELWLQPGLGFAEVQRGADAGGFRFGEQTQPGQNEAAGPEATVSVKGRAWVHERVFGVVEANAGLAIVPAAPAVLGQQPLVPSATLTLGLGF
jgi:hypothetical protein